MCAQSCLTLCGPIDCSLPGSSIHGIFLARMLEWPGDLPDPGIELMSLVSPALAGGFFTSSVTGRKCKGCVFHPWVRKIPWSRKWQSASVLFPGKFHGQKSLAGYGPWGCKESDITEHTLTCYIIYNLCYC